MQKLERKRNARVIAAKIKRILSVWAAEGEEKAERCGGRTYSKIKRGFFLGAFGLHMGRRDQTKEEEEADVGVREE